MYVLFFFATHHPPVITTCSWGSVGPLPCTSHRVRLLDKAVIDLSPKEACTGLTFVCLSRAKRLVDLISEPMSTTQL